ncbi:hypothetical protein BCT01_08435 [Vibrio tasmaniensis]|uniref:Uncharacterized protein n=1 Tax=Vibrio tasmaniensis TaxID=212663 RepID=A0A2N7NNJ1_9VIBR|nr:hypothetical protein BCT01_08435 [Vibrio tasmaniensis]PMP17824.1 hypothetical protein BCS92_05295 [Vibrio tasmaniensis]
MKSIENLLSESAECRNKLTLLSEEIHIKIVPLRQFNIIGLNIITDHLQLTIGLLEIEQALNGHQQLKPITKTTLMMDRKRLIKLANHTIQTSSDWMVKIFERKL